MEEDINILDEVVGRSKELREKDFGMLIGTKQMQSIENLIKGYRELEYKYDKALTDLSIEAKRTNEENYRCSLFAVENNDLKEKLADSISKSKIKEIRDKAEVMDYYTLPDVIEDLNKLLGDEE